MFNYVTMSKKVYIGCGAGFAGDRYDASIPIVEDFKSIKEPKYLMFEVLAERTLAIAQQYRICLLYTSPSPRDRQKSRMPSSA